MMNTMLVLSLFFAHQNSPSSIYLGIYSDKENNPELKKNRHLTPTQPTPTVEKNKGGKTDVMTIKETTTTTSPNCTIWIRRWKLVTSGNMYFKRLNVTRRKGAKIRLHFKRVSFFFSLFFFHSRLDLALQLHLYKLFTDQ